MSTISKKVSILGRAKATKEQMITYLRTINTTAPDYAELYLSVGEKYGVRGDLAFCQAIKETNAWRREGDIDWHSFKNNFAGLGAINKSTEKAVFDTPEQGIEAQIQHLYAYATAKPLPDGTLIIDPRYEVLVNSDLGGSAPYWGDLDGKIQSPGTPYSEEIIRIWRVILAIPTADDWKEEAMEWLKEKKLIEEKHNEDAYVTWAQLGDVLSKLDFLR